MFFSGTCKLPLHITGGCTTLHNKYFSLGCRIGGDDITEVLEILSVGASVVIVPE